MEFWGAEVKSGQPLDVTLGEDKVIHLSQACLGEIKNNKASDSVYLHITINNKKLVLGTLNSERLPQQLFDLVIDRDFQLSHSWKNGSVYFYGYKADQPLGDKTDSDESDSDDEDAIPLPVSNEVKKETPAVVKQEVKKEDNTVAAKKKDGKQKVKIVEPKKDSDEDDSDEGDSMSEDSDEDEGDEDDSSDDSEASSDEDEETPKKQQSGKKRPNESAMKTPATDKKAKLTPQKTDGKKAHVATPHPKKETKTPANNSNQKSSASASTDGAHSCKPCNRTFKSDGALQSH
ncbi:histone deacetylase HDT1-like [Bidens hawaiensis]|uniref:histone deacetylase HDT1-like n=1 Tax=Bidens hawaiensis TaxID=980011 RepID=UPI004049D97C